MPHEEYGVVADNIAGADDLHPDPPRLRSPICLCGCTRRPGRDFFRLPLRSTSAIFKQFRGGVLFQPGGGLPSPRCHSRPLRRVPFQQLPFSIRLTPTIMFGAPTRMESLYAFVFSSETWSAERPWSR